MDNPFADLIPQNANVMSAQNDNPFADLIPATNTAQKGKSSLTGQQIKEADLGGVVGFNTAMGDFAHGIIQPALESGVFGDNVKQGSRQFANNRQATYDVAEEVDPLGANLGKATGYLGQGLMVPGGATGGVLRRIATNAAAGVGLGAAQYVPEGGSRAFNAAVGGVAGGFVPPVISGLTSKNPFTKAGTGAALGTAGGLLATDSPYGVAGSAVAGAALPFAPNLAVNALKPAAQKLLSKVTGQPIANLASRSPLDDAAAIKMLDGVDENAAYKTLRAARKLDPEMWITPAEATGSPLAAKTQGAIAATPKGSQEMFQKGAQRLGTEKRIVGGILDDISPASKSIQEQSPQESIRAVARTVISKQTKALSAKAGPIYKVAYKEVVPQKQINALMQEDGTIENAIKNVLSDPKYKYELKGYAPNSIKVLDLAKRRIDAQINAAEGTFAQKGDADAVRVFTDSKNRLVAAIDKLSPTYAKGRTIYGEGAQPLEKIRNSPLGKIADLDDMQLKNVSKIVFDPAQTDIKVMQQISKQIRSENPDAWSRLVRAEMERRLDKTGNYAGSAFFSKILKSDRDFKQFLEATRGMPNAQRKLIWARRTFKDLIEPVGAKTAARESKLFFTAPGRGSKVDQAIDYATSVAKGKYDEAAIKLITSNRWDKEFEAIHKIKDKSLRTSRFSELLGKVSAIGTADLNNQVFSQENQ